MPLISQSQRTIARRLCWRVLPANVSVVFTPTAPGLRTALLTFTDYAYGSPQTVTLSGRDLAREIREYFIPDFSDSREDRAYQGAIERVLKGLRPMSV